MGLEFELDGLAAPQTDEAIEIYESALAELVAATESLEAAKAREAQARVAMSEAMQALGINKADTEHGVLSLTKKPGKTNVAMSNAAFARQWPHLTKPDVTAANKAAKDDSALKEVLVYEEGNGVVLKFSRRNNSEQIED